MLYSEETKINDFVCDGKVKLLNKGNEELKIKDLQHTVKHGGGNVVVWG